MSERLRIQRRKVAALESDPAPRPFLATGTPERDLSAAVHDTLASGGQPLASQTRALMEPRFGFDFSQIRIFSGDHAAESARAVQAGAFTVGPNIVFGAGQFAPETSRGQWLLAHELAHTVQQAFGPVGGTSTVGGLALSTPGDPFEQDADQAASAVSGALPTAGQVPPAPMAGSTGAALAVQRSGALSCPCQPSTEDGQVAHLMHHVLPSSGTLSRAAALSASQRGWLVPQRVALGPWPRLAVQRAFWDDDEAEEAAGSGAEDTGGGVLDWVSERAGEAVDWATETGGEAVDWASEQAGGVVDWAVEQGGAAVDWVSEQAGGAAGPGLDGASDGAETPEMSLEEAQAVITEQVTAYLDTHGGSLLASFGRDPFSPHPIETCDDRVLEAKADCDDGAQFGGAAVGAISATVIAIVAPGPWKLVAGLGFGLVQALVANWLRRQCVREQIANRHTCEFFRKPGGTF